MTSTAKGREHHVTIPMHRSLGVGTLSDILSDIATHLEADKEELANKLF